MSWLRRNGVHASTESSLPLARDEGLVVEEVGDELLIYDKSTNQAHCLSTTAAKVWRACDGYTTAAVLANQLDLDSDTLGQALHELESNSLLQEPPQLGHTRREMTVKMAKYGAVASIPFIYSVAGPVPMAAATPTPQQCLFYSSGDCNNCTQICGCCCCCQGCHSDSSCKVCYPTTLCNVTNTGDKCVNAGAGNCSTGPNCSVKAPFNPPGCVQPCTPGVPCITNGSTVCGCAGVTTCPST